MNNDLQSQNQNPSATTGLKAPDSTQATPSEGCCQKMMTACKDAFNRFMSARVGISYDITTRMMGDGQSNTQGQQGSNSMKKQGELELRMTDLTIGALMLCAVMSVMCAVKGMCCGQGCAKSKC